MFKALIYNLYRLRWPLGLSIGAMLLLDVVGLDPESDLARLIYKVSIATIACVVGDIITWTIFPRYNLDSYVRAADPSQRQLVGMIYFGRCLVLVAIILGITLGL